MVFVTPNTSGRGKTYESAYKSILTSRRRSPSTSAASVILLVAPEVDALCAARMFSVLFKQDDVTYRIIPVSGYPGLEEIRNELMTHQELHTLILLNIGSVLDLPSPDWFGDFNPQVTVHVIDSARPQNLSSLFAVGVEAQRIVVWDDGSAAKLKEERDALEALLLEPESESESDSASDSDDDPLSDSQSDLDDDPRLLRNPGRDAAKPGLSRHQRNKYRDRIAKHYTSGTWHGQSASGTIYVLATLIERADNDLLWLSILGLTHQYITSRIPRNRYDDYHTIFLDEVARLNPPVTESTISSLHPDDFNIRASGELRFTLFRHWNLYDAMYHSSYVANKLGIWQERGRKKLQGLLAKMGFSLQQCQQTYQHMDMDLKRLLRDKMDDIAPEYGLVELSYPSFVRSFGFRTQPLCAADVVEGVSALLQAAGGVRLEVETEGGQGGGEWFGGSHLWDMRSKSGSERNGSSNDGRKPFGSSLISSGEDDAADVDGHGPEMENWWVRNFWVAFDALGNDIRLVQDALPLSMALHRAIIRQAPHLSTSMPFLAVVKEGPDVPIFCHPGTLSRLGLWLAEALRDRDGIITGSTRGKRKQLPFVVACLNEKAGSYLIVGVTPTSESGDVRKNQFGLAFLGAKDRSNARTRHGTFDTSVVEVNKGGSNSHLGRNSSAPTPKRPPMRLTDADKA
ncbi:hypothetical protein BS47DRAFT_1371034 [Hydnum rufescens UP504]|uniref:CDC45-like protein n=1 Tax=Hydnum rufescens UP504 TaxID=1448309 RepID=A0A9P6B679_9AGAM|nr:hypothetical protein BS47DRAFT_1371034 [Hydnum rufescens UP504]